MKNIFNEIHYTQCLPEDLRNDFTLRQSHKRRLYNEIKILNETDDNETGIN